MEVSYKDIRVQWYDYGEVIFWYKKRWKDHSFNAPGGPMEAFLGSCDSSYIADKLVNKKVDMDEFVPQWEVLRTFFRRPPEELLVRKTLVDIHPWVKDPEAYRVSLEIAIRDAEKAAEKYQDSSLEELGLQVQPQTQKVQVADYNKAVQLAQSLGVLAVAESLQFGADRLVPQTLTKEELGAFKEDTLECLRQDVYDAKEDLKEFDRLVQSERGQNILAAYKALSPKDPE